jgi:hypothetical protein
MWIRHDFTRYLVAAVAAKWGVNIAKVAVPLVAITSLGAGPGTAGALAAAGTVPFLLIGSVPIAAAFAAVTMVQLWVVVFLNGVATVLFDLAMQSHLPDLVDDRRLIAANGRLATVDQLALIGGPALAGWLIGLSTAAAVLVATALGCLWSALWIRRIKRPEPRPAEAARRSLIAEVRVGLSFVGRHRTLRAIALAGALVNFATAGTVAMLPLLLTRESELGLFLGAGGVGGLLAALVAKRLSDALGPGRAVLIIGLAVIPAALLVPFAGGPVPGWLAATAWAMVIFKVGFDSVVLMAFRQRVTPPHLLGRVNGSLRVIFSGALTLGAATAAFVGAPAGPRAAVGVACAALTLVWIPMMRSGLAVRRDQGSSILVRSIV